MCVCGSVRPRDEWMVGTQTFELLGTLRGENNLLATNPAGRLKVHHEKVGFWTATY